MKKIFLSILLVVIIAVSSMTATNSAKAVEPKKSLADMTAEECYETLCDMGLEFPEKIWKDSSEKDKIAFVKEYVDYVLSCKGECIPGSETSYTGTAYMYMKIYPLVIEHEGLENYAESNLASYGVSYDEMVKSLE